VAEEEEEERIRLELCAVIEEAPLVDSLQRVGDFESDL